MIRTTVIGSYPLPGVARARRGTSTRSAPTTSPSCRRTPSIAAVHDQVAAGLDVITDGEQTRLDFNLSFYGYLEGIELESAPAAALRPARARPARPAPRHRRARRAARPRRRRGVRAAARLAPAGPDG